MTFYIKYSNSPNILHIYEHVVSICIHKELQKNGYYCYIDYSLKAQTHDNGCGFIVLEAHNKNLSRVINLKSMNALMFGEKEIYSAYLQVLAEEGVTFRFTNPAYNLVNELARLHNRPWLEEHILPDKNGELINDEILEEDGPIAVSEYEISLHFNFKDVEKSIQKDISSAFGHVLQVLLSNHRGYYRESMSIVKTELTIGFKVLGSATEEISFEKDLLLLKKIAFDLLKSNSIFAMLDNRVQKQNLPKLSAMIEQSINTWSSEYFKIQ